MNPGVKPFTLSSRFCFLCFPFFLFFPFCFPQGTAATWVEGAPRPRSPRGRSVASGRTKVATAIPQEPVPFFLEPTKGSFGWSNPMGCHVGWWVNSPPILEPILMVGLDWLMFTGGTIWLLTHAHFVGPLNTQCFALGSPCVTNIYIYIYIYCAKASAGITRWRRIFRTDGAFCCVPPCLVGFKGKPKKENHNFAGLPRKDTPRWGDRPHVFFPECCIPLPSPHPGKPRIPDL